MNKDEQSWARTSISIDKEVLHVLDKVPKTELVNRSRLIETFLREWLTMHGYKITGSIKQRDEE
jgi:metal-responsive CopG/Arc/MetJ family transcriptional regulator